MPRYFLGFLATGARDHGETLKKKTHTQRHKGRPREDPLPVHDPHFGTRGPTFRVQSIKVKNSSESTVSDGKLKRTASAL